MEVVRDCLIEKTPIPAEVLRALTADDVNQYLGTSVLTPLMYACQHGCDVIVEQLLSVEGIDVNMRNLHDECSALFYAVESFHRDEAKRVKCVQLLVGAGADINQLRLGERYPTATVLSRACCYAHSGRTQSVQYLLNLGAEMNGDVLLWASLNYDYIVESDKILRRCLFEGVSFPPDKDLPEAYVRIKAALMREIGERVSVLEQQDDLFYKKHGIEKPAYGSGIAVVGAPPWYLKYEKLMPIYGKLVSEYIRWKERQQDAKAGGESKISVVVSSNLALRF